MLAASICDETTAECENILVEIMKLRLKNISELLLFLQT
jgi:hypothetical protein